MLTKEQKLARIARYSTRYELAAVRGDQKVLVCYSASRSRQTILSLCRQWAARLTALTGSETIGFAKKAEDGAAMGAWKIRFTGRTQREAIIEGELPFIGADPEVITWTPIKDQTLLPFGINVIDSRLSLDGAVTEKPGGGSNLMGAWRIHVILGSGADSRCSYFWDGVSEEAAMIEVARIQPMYPTLPINRFKVSE